mgnify:CR=1 FL=1
MQNGKDDGVSRRISGGRQARKYENVHNEYLQYLVTIGAVGLTAYLAFLGTSFVKMVREGFKSLS